MAESTPSSSVSAATAEPAVPGGLLQGAGAKPPARPSWLQRRRSGDQRDSTNTPGSAESVVEIEETAQPELTWQDRFGDWVLSRAAAAYLISLLVHLLLLIHVPRWQSSETDAITTVVEGEHHLVQPFDELQDVELPVIGGERDEANPQQFLAENSDRDLNLLEHKFLEDVTAADTQGEDAGSGIGTGGFRFLEPKNAVRVGSFTAWTIPIAQRFGEQPEAGDAPRPGQAYHIVIQIRMPEGRNNYSINDLSGKVTGTDSYVQMIPAGAWVVDEESQNLVRVKLGRRLPVVDGVVQILIRVPGAEALVKDTIMVKSRILKEEQTLELVFGGRSGL